MFKRIREFFCIVRLRKENRWMYKCLENAQEELSEYCDMNPPVAPSSMPTENSAMHMVDEIESLLCDIDKSRKKWYFS